jgi:F-type H+-transporting ATPase subunit c
LGVTEVAKKIVLLFILFAFVVVVQPAMAQDQATGAGEGSINKWIAIACAFGLGLASAVCGIAQSNAIRSAVDGIARNPGAADNIRGALIIGLALIESLVIYVLLIAFMLYFKWA